MGGSISLDLETIFPIIVQNDGRYVEMSHGVRVDQVDQAAIHQSVTVIPATRLIVRGWRESTTHDILIGMLYGRREKS